MHLNHGAVVSAEIVNAEAYHRLEAESTSEQGFGTRWFIIQADSENDAVQITEKVVRILWGTG